MKIPKVVKRVVNLDKGYHVELLPGYKFTVNDDHSCDFTTYRELEKGMRLTRIQACDCKKCEGLSIEGVKLNNSSSVAGAVEKRNEHVFTVVGSYHDSNPNMSVRRLSIYCAHLFDQFDEKSLYSLLISYKYTEWRKNGTMYKREDDTSQPRMKKLLTSKWV
jgi:hypothetical protein